MRRSKREKDGQKKDKNGHKKKGGANDIYRLFAYTLAPHFDQKEVLVFNCNNFLIVK